MQFIIKKIHITFLFTLFCFTTGIGQSIPTSIPFIQSFSKDVYHSALHNWKIDQDDRGIMYFANDGGMLGKE